MDVDSPALALALVVTLVLAGCLTGAAPEPGFPSVPPAVAPAASHFPPREDSPSVTIETTRGRIVVQLADEMVPGVAASLANLTKTGFYDGTRFHRVAKGFLVQGGDPNSRGEDASTWGYGGPGYVLPDEFHPLLCFDAPGIVGMAKSAPDTLGSQFFITLAPAPALDDKETIVGRVVEGLDVVLAIAAAPNRGGLADGAPVQPVVVTRATYAAAQRALPAEHRVSLVAPLPDRTTQPGRPATFAVVVKNEGTRRDRFALSLDPPAGWSFSTDAGPVGLDVPAGTARVALVMLTPSQDARTNASVDLVASAVGDTSGSATVRLVATLGQLGARPYKQGDAPHVDYVALLADGRLVDTTLRAVAEDARLEKALAARQPRLAYAPSTLTLGRDLIPGFDRLAEGARPGETVAARVPWMVGYPASDPLYHRDLVFDVRFLAAGGAG
jgi:peptidyl-prolyl cis-trans isomerase A (cyclophilin A)